MRDHHASSQKLICLSFFSSYFTVDPPAEEEALTDISVWSECKHALQHDERHICKNQQTRKLNIEITEKP